MHKNRRLSGENYLLTIQLADVSIYSTVKKICNAFKRSDSIEIEMFMNWSRLQSREKGPEKKMIGFHSSVVIMEKLHAAPMMQDAVQVQFFLLLSLNRENKCSDNIAVIHFNSHVVNIAGSFSAIHLSIALIALNSRFP